MARIGFVMCLVLQFLVAPFALAADAGPKFSCTMSDTVENDEIGDAKDSFTKDTPKIFLYCSSSSVKKDQAIKGEWIAVDTNNVAPANYKIDESSINVPADLTASQAFDAKFSVSKPNNGWPVGKYQINVYVDDKLDQSVKFSVN